MPKEPRKPKEPELKSRRRRAILILKILQDEDGKVTETYYTVRPIRHEIEGMVRAYQVRKQDGQTVYHVMQEMTGRIDCDCGARTFGGGPCKHGKALQAEGLFFSAWELQAIRNHMMRERSR